MADITDVPYEDVKLFLINNNQKVPKSKKQAYDSLFKLIKKENEYYPDSIVEWLTAYNLIQLKIIVPKYKTSEILSLSKDDLLKISKLFKIKTTKTNHIINILKYLHKLEDDQEYLNLLPPELLEHIIENSDGKSIINFCSTSKELDNLCYSKRYRDILQKKLSEVYLDISKFSNDEVKNYFKILYLKRRFIISGDFFLIENNKLYRISSFSPLTHLITKPIETIRNKKESLCDNVNQIASSYQGYLYVLKTDGKVIFFDIKTLKETELFILDKVINITNPEHPGILNIKTANGKFYKWFDDTGRLIEVFGLKDIIQITKPYKFDDSSTKSLALTSEGDVYDMINTDNFYQFRKIDIFKNIIQISENKKYFLDINGDVYTLGDDKLHLELSNNVKQISNSGALTVSDEFFDLKTKELLASNIAELPILGDNRYCLSKNGDIIKLKLSNDLELQEEDYDLELDEGDYDEYEDYDDENYVGFLV